MCGLISSHYSNASHAVAVLDLDRKEGGQDHDALSFLFGPAMGNGQSDYP